MKASGLKTLTAAVLGEVSSIIGQEEQWVHVMRACRMASFINLQSFLQTGFKSWDELCKYLEKTCLHPTGRY